MGPSLIKSELFIYIMLQKVAKLKCMGIEIISEECIHRQAFLITCHMDKLTTLFSSVANVGSNTIES